VSVGGVTVSERTPTYYGRSRPGRTWCSGMIAAKVGQECASAASAKLAMNSCTHFPADWRQDFVEAVRHEVAPDEWSVASHHGPDLCPCRFLTRACPGTRTLTRLGDTNLSSKTLCLIATHTFATNSLHQVLREFVAKVCRHCPLISRDCTRKSSCPLSHEDRRPQTVGQHRILNTYPTSCVRLPERHANPFTPNTCKATLCAGTSQVTRQAAQARAQHVRQHGDRRPSMHGRSSARAGPHIATLTYQLLTAGQWSW
jgi:hypothetical protein